VYDDHTRGDSGMAAIFISYRREDAAGHAGRLCDRLSQVFGGHSVFMDVEDIRPGEDFTRAIRDKIAGCQLLIAVIGPRWLATLRERMGGQDFVRAELAAALERKIAVIPVLVGGARMPGPEDLPAALAPLSRHNAIEISDTRFDQDSARLSSFVRETVGAGDRGRRRWRLPAVAALAAVAALVAFLAFRSGDEPVNVDGNWNALMKMEGQPPYRIRLTFAAAGGTLSGTVNYPTGTGAIRDGKLTGSHLTFHTTHIPQFENKPATIQLQGDVVGEKIHLVLTSDGGMAKGIAERADR
jgi:hypothetical protein